MNNLISWSIHSQKTLAQTFDEQIWKKYLDVLESPEVGFFRLPREHQLVESCLEVAKKFPHKQTFIHVGIGGSALGPEMLINALGVPSKRKFLFINNIDPDQIHRLLNSVDISQALFYVVSKSGTTAETIAALALIVKELKNHGIDEGQWAQYLVFCTDPEVGDLRKIALKHQLSCLEIPANVGGRYSVLSPVGLLPLIFAGHDPQALISGAQQIAPSLSQKDKAHDFLALASWIKELHEQGLKQTVIMPYSSLLKDFSSWFVQLWAESLGKEGRGLTPIPAYGATDQHSQMQLFMEGPRDKVLMLLEIASFKHDYSLRSNLEFSSFQNLAPYSLSQLMQAELKGTIQALKENQRPLIHIRLPILNSESLGQLILFSECLTVLTGLLLEVNPFNQPGVEAGKKYAYIWLKSQV